MAEAVVEFVLQIITSPIQKELTLYFGLEEDFEGLTSRLTAIKATLEDAEEKQFSDRAIKHWLQKLNDAAHILDDIFDEFKYEQANKVQNSCLSSFHPKHAVLRGKIAKKMKRIRERLDEIAEEKNKFCLIPVHPARRTTGDMEKRQTFSELPQHQIYGREEDENKIIDFLVGDASNSDVLSIIPIVGMGGLGKTTLAQLIFNHERVVNHFEQRIWVCVSEDFSLKRMMKAIIGSNEHLDLEPLKEKLKQLLQSKRYLLVLDDVWDHDQDNWERLRYVLACGAKGTSILVTTRLTKVASVMGTTTPNKLSMLSDDHCWELIKQRAFGLNEMERSELVIIGKEIAKKCGGVPLAAKALGSLLRFKRKEKEWRNVKESKLWNLASGNEQSNPQDDISIMPALSLSYLNLPLEYRQCFSFCALFPKDTVINKHFLIDLWVANGFISSNGTSEAEDIGEQVCDELCWTSFFQDINRDEFGNITSFKMHDLVHDLAQYVAKEICHIDDHSGLTGMVERIRHLSIGTYANSRTYANSIQLCQAKSLRTCIFPSYIFCGRLPLDVFRCYSLRVLHKEWLHKLSSSIGDLKLLRYLNLSHGKFKTLPESLCKLLNLQILNLDDCCDLEKLPNCLKCLKALRHLYLSRCLSLSSLPPEIGKLTSLRTLSIYVVGKQKGHLLAELGELNLKGELHIKHLERVKSVMDAKDAKMASKQLNRLVLSWDKKVESQVQENREQILEVLQPHLEQLQTLEVKGYTGVEFTRWMTSPSLSKLISVSLVDCESCSHLPPMGELKSLKRLLIEDMKLVEYVDNETYDAGVAGGYIALEFLVLKSLPNLVRLSKEVGESMFQHLSKLQIIDCPKLALPCLPSLKQLKIKGKCNQDLLRSISKYRSL